MSKEEEELPQKEEIKEKPKETDNGSNVIKKGEDYELLAEDYSNYDIAFKIIVIGNAGVGKSCLSMQVLKLQIWDTCGQEVYRSLITSFYKNSSLAIIVYAIDE